MALKAAAVVMYMLLSGCRASPYIDENGWAPANDQGRGMFAEEDAVRNPYSALNDAEANEPETQEAVDNDPYWNWGNDNDMETETMQNWQDAPNTLDGQQQDFSDWDNAMDGQQQDFSDWDNAMDGQQQDFNDWDNAMDGQQQDFSDWDNAMDGQQQDFNDWGKPEPEETVEIQENDNLDWGWGDMQEHGDPGYNQPSDSDTTNPGGPAVEQDLSPDDIMVQFFNHPGDPQVLQQEVDWNDRDFLKEEFEANGQRMDWNIPEENNEAMPQDMDWNDDAFLTDQAEDQQSEPIEQQYMKNNDMPSDANIEELWNELNEIQQPHVQETASDISAQVDAIYKQMSITQAKIEELEKKQEKAADLSECKVCTKCGVETCCEYEPGCKERHEAARDSIGTELEKATQELEEMEKKLGELADKQKKAENMP